MQKSCILSAEVNDIPLKVSRRSPAHLSEIVICLLVINIWHRCVCTRLDEKF